MRVRNSAKFPTDQTSWQAAVAAAVATAVERPDGGGGSSVGERGLAGWRGGDEKIFASKEASRKTCCSAISHKCCTRPFREERLWQYSKFRILLRKQFCTWARIYLQIEVYPSDSILVLSFFVRPGGHAEPRKPGSGRQFRKSKTRHIY
jgi:hypothetical protein